MEAWAEVEVEVRVHVGRQGSMNTGQEITWQTTRQELEKVQHGGEIARACSMLNRTD